MGRISHLGTLYPDHVYSAYVYSPDPAIEKTLGISGSSGGGGTGAWCRPSASYDASYVDYDIYVHSNQPRRTVTATASNGASHSWTTDSSGYAVVYLRAGAGDTIRVTVGADPAPPGPSNAERSGSPPRRAGPP